MSDTFFEIVQISEDGVVHPVTIVEERIPWVGRHRYSFPLMAASRFFAESMVADLNKKVVGLGFRYAFRPVKVERGEVVG